MHDTPRRAAARVESKSSNASEITRLLEAWRDGDAEGAKRLFELVYRELHHLAHRQLVRGLPGNTLVTTGLVHEAYVKLVDRSRASFESRGHFLAVAAKAMRQILVDHARKRAAQKRGGRLHRTTLEAGKIPIEERAAEVVALDEALVRLEELEPRLAQVVELRFFGGSSVDETAEALEVSPRTVKRDWQKARAFLYAELDRSTDR